MDENEGTISRLDPILFSSGWLADHSWLKPTEYYLSERRSSRNVSERRRSLYLALMSRIKEFNYPWAAYTPKVPAQDIFEELGVAISSMGEGCEISDVNAFSLWPESEIQINPLLRATPRATDFALFHEFYHGVFLHGHGLEWTFQHTGKRPAVETLANCFAKEISWPLPAVSALAAGSSAKVSLEYFSDNLDDLIRVTSRPVFLVQYRIGSCNTSVEGLKHLQVLRIIIRAPDRYGESLDDLKRIASEDGDKSLTNADWRPPPTGASMITREGLHYEFGLRDISQWLVASGFLPEFEPPSEDEPVTRSKDLDQGYSAMGHRLIDRGLYFLLYIYLGDRTFTLVATGDDDDSLSRAWSDAYNRGQKGPLLPWSDPMRYSQPESYEEWVSNTECQFLHID